MKLDSHFSHDKIRLNTDDDKEFKNRLVPNIPDYFQSKEVFLSDQNSCNSQPLNR